MHIFYLQKDVYFFFFFLNVNFYFKVKKNLLLLEPLVFLMEDLFFLITERVPLWNVVQKW